ncbi:TetR family transcriptional regulator [Rhodococcus chondri]|uniref:TetR family transcriptional regulator n=1 Tax=Rhodococcus chondri TaxID=3065941 RepID=A0ABU7JQJ4_9NOCA|nr:TetR family transcriptional regulator [Rhodococcus sp. CC-R104]MEE2032298.1 TetR family transcriptional regulator [Rhodococcus sp. CC-R104]
MPRIGVARDGAEPTSVEQRERHLRIIDAASRLASEHELARVQMTEVAKLAGVAIGTLYRYFPSKTHLFVGVLLHRLELSADRIPAPGADVSPQDAICAALIALTRQLVSRPKLALAMLVSNSTATVSAVPDALRVDELFQQLILRVGGITGPTEQDRDAVRLLAMLWFGVITVYLNNRATLEETEADIRLSCRLLLVHISQTSS